MLFHEAWKGQFWQRTPIFQSDNLKIVGFASCVKITIFLLCLPPHNRKQTWTGLCRLIMAAAIKILIERTEGSNSCGTSLLFSMETNWNASITIPLINSEMFFAMCVRKWLKFETLLSNIIFFIHTFIMEAESRSPVTWAKLSYPPPERLRQTDKWLRFYAQELRGNNSSWMKGQW